MLHWPDSMFTYLKEDRILFSSDGFGQHYAGHEQFDDEMGDAIMPHAKNTSPTSCCSMPPALKADRQGQRDGIWPST